jgi:hypothetical protein
MDPDSIGSVDPDPYPDPDPGGQKRLTKVDKFKNFMFGSAGLLNVLF